MRATKDCAYPVCEACLHHVWHGYKGAVKASAAAGRSGSIPAEAAGLQEQDKSNAAAL